MKNIIFVLCVLSSVVSFSQANNYLNYNERRHNFMFSTNALNIPSMGTPALQTGQYVRSGAIIYDSTGGNKGIHVWNGSTWVRMVDTTMSANVTGTATKFAFFNPSTGFINSAENVVYKASPANRNPFGPLTINNEGTVTINAMNYSELGIVGHYADFGAVSNDIYNHYETGVNPAGSTQDYSAASASLTIAAVNSTQGINLIPFAGFKGNTLADSAVALFYNGKGMNIASNGNNGYIRFGGGYTTNEYARFAATTGYLGIRNASPLYPLTVNDSAKLVDIIFDREPEFSGPRIKTTSYLTIQNYLNSSTNGANTNLTIFQATNQSANELRFTGGNGGAMSPGVGVINGFNYDGPARQDLILTTAGFTENKAGNIRLVPGSNYGRSGSKSLTQNFSDSVQVILNTSGTGTLYLNHSFSTPGFSRITDTTGYDVDMIERSTGNHKKMYAGLIGSGGGGSQTPWTSNINGDGFTLFGNDGSGESLTIGSTSHATKGNINFGAVAKVDEANNWIVANNANTNKIFIGAASGFEAYPIIGFGSSAPSISTYAFLGDVAGGGTVLNGQTYLSLRNNNTDVLKITSAGALLKSDLVGIGGVYHTNVTDVGNVGGGEDNLMTKTVDAGLLAVDKEFLEFTLTFTVAADADIRVYFGANQLVLFSATAANSNYRIKGEIIRTGAATQKAQGEVYAGTAFIGAFRSLPTETLSGTVVFKSTGESTDGTPVNNDVIQTSAILKWYPAK